MRKFLKKRNLEENLNLIEPQTFRKGTYGDWKTVLDEEILEEDTIFHKNGAKVVIDAVSIEFLAGAIILNASWFLGGAPNAGWFGYAPITGKAYNVGHGIDFWIISLQVLGIASLAAAFNFIVTIINMRAPGMTFSRLPVFTWMSFITAILLVLAFPVITVALIELQFDRFYGTNFFITSAFFFLLITFL